MFPSWPCRRVVVLLLQAWASLVFLWVVWTWTTASPLSLIYSVPPSSIPPPSPSDSAPLPCPSATPQPSVLSTNTTPPLLPTWSQLDGFSRWGSCDYLSRPTCTGPYLHLLVPHSGRPKNLARLVRSFGPHTHLAEEVACTCLLVADVIVPVGRDVASAGLGDDDNDPVREGMQSWPGPHTLLRWRGKFSKVIAMDQLLNTITTPPNKTIAFVLDVDLVVKNGTIGKLRSEPRLGKAFYAPIVWKLEKPSNNSAEVEAEWEPNGQVVVTKTRGAWRTVGFGMLAFYKQDFDKAGGFQAVADKMHAAKHSLYNWGLEDVLHAALLRESGLKQVRPRAPELIHLWHAPVPH